MAYAKNDNKSKMYIHSCPPSRERETSLGIGMSSHLSDDFAAWFIVMDLS